MHLDAKSVRNSSSAGRAWSALSREVAGGSISLAFLALNLVKAAVEGRLPRGIGVQRLRDPPTEWSQQFEAHGLSPE
jgi:hypothetical protein